MSKWRPTKSGCLYIIPDIHGSYNMLQQICNRILPLRKTGGVQDKIIFLGDYIDRHQDSHLVIDKLIELKKEYKEQIIFLIGNHELLLLETLGIAEKYYGELNPTANAQHMWIMNGGFQTLIGYLDRNNIGDIGSPLDLPAYRIKNFLPKEHLDFFTSLELYHENENFIFVHGGFDLQKPIKENTVDILTWDRKIFNSIKKGFPITFPENKILICGHSHYGPVIFNNYMMLDCGAPKQLLVVELNSMTAYMAQPNKNRMNKYEIKETSISKPLFRRV